jgi:CubicO group peptidase (beta-lactamase class C family)
MTERSDDLAKVLSRFGADEPAVVIGRLAHGELTSWAGVGLASLEHRAPASPTTVFDIASVSKHVTSTCLLLLEDDGLLSLDDDLRDHLPGMRLRVPVTLRQCAQHVSGLREYMAVNALVGASPASWRTEEQVVRQLSAYLDTDFPPGEQWSYSNTGYIALAAVIRCVSGSPLSQLAQQRVLGPLGMTQSRFQDDAGLVVPGRATGYSAAAAAGGGGFRRADSPDEVVGDGGLLTTLVDLARWHGFLADGRVLGKHVRDRLLERAVLIDGRVLPYALGLQHDLVAGRRAVGHGGSIDGYRAHLLHLPEDGWGIAVLANRSDADVAAVARQAVAAVLGVPTSPPAARPAATTEAPAGLWFSTREQTFVETAQEADALVLSLGAARVRFVPAAPAAWRPEILGADITLLVDDARLQLALGDDDWNATTYDRVVPDARARVDGLVGTYLSRELGAVAVVAAAPGGLVLTVGAAREQPLHAVQDDLLRTPTHTVRPERDQDGAVTALLLSGSRMRAVRFDTAPRAVAAGFPVSAGGPLPA